MSQIIIECPRCAEVTHVAMDQSLTSQRCEHCGQFLYGAETGVKAEPELRRRRKKHWRSITGTAANELKTATVDDSDVFQRKGWQRWFLPMSGVALALVVGVIWWLTNRARNERGLNKEPDVVMQTSLQKKASENKKDLPSTGVAPPTSVAPDPAWAAKAHDVSEKFLKATTADEILPLVRNRESFEKSIQKFAAKEGNLPIAKDGVMDILYAPEENGKSGTLAMLFFQNREDRVQGLVLSETAEGLKVDWPSFSGEGEMSIKDFLLTKPTDPILLRVAARRDDYFNFEFDNKDLLTCLRLTDYPETQYFYGYVPKGSPLEKKILNLAKYDHSLSADLQEKPQPLTIKARFHLGSKSPNQVEVLEIIGNGWYVP